MIYVEVSTYIHIFWVDGEKVEVESKFLMPDLVWEEHCEKNGLELTDTPNHSECYSTNKKIVVPLYG
jgi:hypothetical protein